MLFREDGQVGAHLGTRPDAVRVHVATVGWPVKEGDYLRPEAVEIRPGKPAGVRDQVERQWEGEGLANVKELVTLDTVEEAVLPVPGHRPERRDRRRGEQAPNKIEV